MPSKRSSDSEGHLATYGTWNLARFFSLASDENRLVVVLAAQDVGTEANNARIGCAVRRLWDAVIGVLPGAIGHRLSWRQLIFFAETAAVPDAVFAITPLTTSFVPGVDVRAAIQLAPLGPPTRVKFCDELVAGLAKVEYRQGYPAAWCIVGGDLVHRP